jgi:hypothetical protein
MPPNPAADPGMDMGLGAMAPPNSNGGGGGAGLGPSAASQPNPQQANGGPGPSTQMSPGQSPTPPATPPTPEIGELTEEELDEWVHDTFSDWAEDLLPKEKAALRTLKRGGFDKLLQGLRRGGSIPKDQHTDIETLDAAIKRARLPHDIVVYKVIKLPPDIEDIAYLRGKTICDHAYSIATLRQALLSCTTLCKGWVMAEIQVPEGFSCAPLDFVQQQRQYCMVLPRSTKFSVVLAQPPNPLNSGVLTLIAQDIGTL